MYYWTARTPVFLHDRVESCRIWDAPVLPVYASSRCHLHRSMHHKWVQVLEQMLWTAHKIFRRTSNVVIPPLLFIYYKRHIFFSLCLQLHGPLYVAGFALGWWLNCTKEQLMGNLQGSIESTTLLDIAMLRNRNPQLSCWMPEPKLELYTLLTTSMERVEGRLLRLNYRSGIYLNICNGCCSKYLVGLGWCVVC